MSTFAVMLFVAVLASVIGSRLDQNTVLLLGGATVGLLVAAPAATLITWLALRRRDEQAPANAAAPRYSIPMPQSPPQYWVMPTVQPATPPNYMAPVQRQLPPANQQLSWTQPPEFSMPPRRKFYMIGDGGEVEELMDDAAGEPGFSFG